MPKHPYPYERMLVVAGTTLALAIVGSTALTMQKFNSEHTVDVTQTSGALPDIGLAKVQLASARITNPTLWNGDHLFVSEPTFLQEGKLRPFESRLPDAWLAQYAFAKTDPFIDTRDPDQDLFTNLEEWQAKTDPTSASSHPPAIAKVSLVAMIESDLQLVFRGRVDADRWQVDLFSKATHRSANYLPAMGGRFGPKERFRLTRYEENHGTDDQGIPQDNSVITISYAEAGRTERATAKLTHGIDWEMPTHQARFFNPFDQSEFTLRRGQSVRLEADPDIDYTLVGVTAKGAHFQDPSGKVHEVFPQE
jgi:hypothetical protein